MYVRENYHNFFQAVDLIDLFSVGNVLHGGIKL